MISLESFLFQNVKNILCAVKRASEGFGRQQVDFPCSIDFCWLGQRNLWLPGLLSFDTRTFLPYLVTCGWPSRCQRLTRPQGSRFYVGWQWLAGGIEVTLARGFWPLGQKKGREELMNHPHTELGWIGVTRVQICITYQLLNDLHWWSVYHDNHPGPWEFCQHVI